MTQKGSHIRLERGKRRVTLPGHEAKDVHLGTLRHVLRQAGITIEEFEALRKG